MAETPKIKTAGLDLLDRLYRNHMLVDLVFSEDERQSLHLVAEQVRAMLIEEEFNGLALERAIHCVLACIESIVADSPDDRLNALKIEVELPPDFDKESYRRTIKFLRDRATATFLAYGTFGQSNPSGIKRVVNALIGYCSCLPVTLRQRLAERVFAVEFPLAPLEVLTWMARNDILVPAKYRGTSAITHSLDPVSIRAVSLWEQDNIRQVILSSTPGAGITRMHRVITRHFGRHLTDGGMIWLADALKIESKRMRSTRSVRHIDPTRWDNASYLHDVLKGFHTLAPWRGTDIGTQSTAVSDIGASLMGRAKLRDYKHALIRGDGLQPTLSDEYADLLIRYGFQINPKTLYNHYKDTHLDRAEKINGCYQMMRVGNTTFPVEYPDFFRMFQVALTA